MDSTFGVKTNLPPAQTLLQGYSGNVIIKGLIYGLLLAVIVIAVDAFFPFLPVNPIAKPSAAARAGKTFWKVLPGDAENLIVPEKESPTRQAARYSVSFQMIIGDSRSPMSGYYRHVLHRGANPCGIPIPPTPGPSGHSGIQLGELVDAGQSDPQYLANGLPQIMNPGFFLDAYRNDLHIFVHTRGAEDAQPALWLESTTVEDLPINTPITVGAVCNGRTLEVYINCKLYSTMILKGQPYMPKGDNQWFGRYCAFPLTGLVKNLTLWQDALNSDDFITVCRGADFSKDFIPTGCATPTIPPPKPTPK